MRVLECQRIKQCIHFTARAHRAFAHKAARASRGTSRGSEQKTKPYEKIVQEAIFLVRKYAMQVKFGIGLAFALWQ